jgi:DDE superfamily endonuclease
LTDRYNLANIFNCDETAFNWKAGPTRTLATRRRAGKKNKKKKRITVLLCSNADGSTKLDPLFIGTAKKPN